MSKCSDPRQAGRQEGERRKDAALSILEDRRGALIRGARRALLGRLLAAAVPPIARGVR
jgi:hypothetical protein